MFQFFVNTEGGLTTAGYVLCIAAGIILFVAALIFAGRISEKKKMGTACILRHGYGTGIYHILSEAV